MSKRVPLNVASWGDPNQPACLCLHGITANASSWGGLAPRLAERGYRVLAPELRGHGESPKPATGYDLATLLADLTASVPADPVLIIGHSFGGALAQRAVLDGVFAPRALILEDPVSHQPDAAQAAAMLEWDRANLPRDIDGLLRLNPRWTRVDAAGKVLSLEQVDWDAAKSAFADNAPWDLRGEAATLAARLPTRWVLPAASRFVPDGDRDVLTDAVGADAVIVIPGVGHSIHRDDPGAFLTVVDDFLAQVPGR